MGGVVNPSSVIMKMIRNYLLPVFGFACMTAAAHATVELLFSNAGDQSVFGSGTAAITNPIPNPLTGAGWGVMSGSGLDGDALRFWDTDTTRATVRYHKSYTAGVQFKFDGLIESGGSGQNLWRIGATGANLSGGAVTVANVELKSDGNLFFRGDTVNVGLDTRFSFSLVMNAAESGGSSISYDQNGVMVNLDPQEFSVYVNNSRIGTYASTLATADIGTAWFLTGNAGANPGPTMQIDNYEVRTGESMSAIPEPTTYAFIAGLGGLGLAFLRRRRQS